mmetsp:Transcript_7153/g.10897  ORF Transcript_7153/g.10897 Transcript_7153/m.10897 type:complete len:221 (-) Transcript_7153:130-792(-)|eukprot:CAMPEP_0167740350 /NCGR_PEP_ID=MMETSP0110_2-20121227/226_1 /TAXON_ID=629695 /ORGANISM="Gymnochlora sp., Strain CCMP2014" /LENGTH=220 /DNA_ID=CAMNT_0007624229 /DNA_START=113 /DNA_END=775 /DNA_ORIENTATION=-
MADGKAKAPGEAPGQAPGRDEGGKSPATSPFSYRETKILPKWPFAKQTPESMAAWGLVGGSVGAIGGYAIGLARVLPAPSSAAMRGALDIGLALPAYHAIQDRLDFRRPHLGIINAAISGSVVGWFVGGYNFLGAVRSVRGSVAGATCFALTGVLSRVFFENSDKIKNTKFSTLVPEIPEWFPIQVINKESSADDTNSRKANSEAVRNGKGDGKGESTKP